MNDEELRTDRFGTLLARSLREGPSVRLPSDFAARLKAGAIGEPRAASSGLPRWLRIAASVAALASFVSLAAVVGRAVFDPPEEGETETAPAETAAAIAEEGPVDPETEMISRKGENTMIVRKMASLVGAAMVSVAVPAQELTSEPTFVFLRPETSSFWNTTTNNTMTVPIDFPAGATVASLEVSGLGYAHTYSNITGSDFTFELPAPTSPETENVYDLTLTFDNNVTRTAKLGLIQGLMPGGEGTTRCIAPCGGSVWEKIRGRAVLPIPYGTEVLNVDGVDVDTGLNGAQGWYALDGFVSGEGKIVSLFGDEAHGWYFNTWLVGDSCGLLIIFK